MIENQHPLFFFVRMFMTKTCKMISYCLPYHFTCRHRYTDVNRSFVKVAPGCPDSGTVGP